MLNTKVLLGVPWGGVGVRMVVGFSSPLAYEKFFGFLWLVFSVGHFHYCESRLSAWALISTTTWSTLLAKSGIIDLDSSPKWK